MDFKSKIWFRLTLGILFGSGLSLFFVTIASGQIKDELVLIVESKITLSPVTPGQAGWETKAKGEAYLQAKSGGKFSGPGELSVTYDFLHAPNPYFKYSSMKGEGSFEVKGVKEGKNLRFWFEHGRIPVRGTLTVNIPPTSKTEPHVQTFDPHTLAPGGPELERGVTIELRDGATATIEVPGVGKTTFTLHGIELWRVSIVGEETDKYQPNIQNEKLRNESKELPIAVKFDWKLVGEFTVIGSGSNRSYLNGQVFSIDVQPILIFDHDDLYRCESTECMDWTKEGALVGKSIGGTVTGNSVRLKWPDFFPVECLRCTPRKSYLGRIRYQQNFGTKEFTGAISREELPLVNGKVVRGGVSDWMQYSITLRKLD